LTESATFREGGLPYLKAFGRIGSAGPQLKYLHSIMIQETSLETYLENVYVNLGHRRAVVLHHLRNASVALTNAEIAAKLSRPIIEITPRTNELRKMGLVLS